MLSLVVLNCLQTRSLLLVGELESPLAAIGASPRSITTPGQAASARPHRCLDAASLLGHALGLSSVREVVLRTKVVIGEKVGKQCSLTIGLEACLPHPGQQSLGKHCENCKRYAHSGWRGKLTTGQVSLNNLVERGDEGSSNKLDGKGMFLPCCCTKKGSPVCCQAAEQWKNKQDSQKGCSLSIL